MTGITWIQPYYDLVLNMIPKDTKTILDVGSGYGIFGYILHKSRDLDLLVSLDPFHYFHGHYDKSYITTWKDYYQNHSQYTDVLVSTEMIEHLPKSEALTFLNETKVSTQHVIIATPFEFTNQESYDNNEYQRHRCNVTIKEFKEKDYKVRIVGSFSICGLTLRAMYHEKFMKLMKLIGFKHDNIIAEWRCEK